MKRTKDPIHVLDSSMWIRLANEHPSILHQLCSWASLNSVHIGVPATVELEVVGIKAQASLQRRRKDWQSRIGELEVFLRLIASNPKAPEIVECERALQTLRSLAASCKSDPQSDAIARLFTSTCVVRIDCPSSLHKDVVAMGLERRKPFGKKNSVADAIILLSVVRWAKKKSRPVVFHTLNSEDFSDEKDPDKPHGDLSKLFSPSTNVAFSYGYGPLIKIIEELDDIDWSGPPRWGFCLMCDEAVPIESISCLACGDLPSRIPDDENYKLTQRGDGYLVDSWREDGRVERLECRSCGRKTFDIQLPSLCSYHQHMADSD